MATLKTPLCALLGIEFPILHAEMGGVAYGRLAAAVSNAGGLHAPGSRSGCGGLSIGGRWRANGQTFWSGRPEKQATVDEARFTA